MKTVNLEGISDRPLPNGQSSLTSQPKTHDAWGGGKKYKIEPKKSLGVSYKGQRFTKGAPKFTDDDKEAAEYKKHGLLSVKVNPAIAAQKRLEEAEKLKSLEINVESLKAKQESAIKALMDRGVPNDEIKQILQLESEPATKSADENTDEPPKATKAKSAKGKK